MTIHQFIAKVNAISKIGLSFSKDAYAIENYEQLLNLSNEMLNQLLKQPLQTEFFEHAIYPTPSVSVRVLLFNDQGQLLMVKEKLENRWSVPGGWCDVFESPIENAIKECRQEAGVDVSIERVLQISFRDLYKEPKYSLISEYSIYFLGKIKGGDFQYNHEITDLAFFNPNQLPPLSGKNSMIELQRALQAVSSNRAYIE